MTTALAALHAGRMAEAERLYRRTLRTAPNDTDALHGLGIIQLASGLPLRAIGFFERALRASAPTSVLLNNHATALNALHRPADALASLDRAITLSPTDATLHYNRGNTLMSLLRDEDALAAHVRAIELSPRMATAWQNRALVETRLGRHEAALASCDQLIALTPQDAEARESRGEALMALGRPAEALADFEAAAASAPDMALAYHNKGYALQVTGRLPEAIAAIDSALNANPDFAVAHFNAAFVCLSMGDYARGWHEYEWRWRKPDFKPYDRHFREPQWTGAQPLAGRTILLHAEQGFGDTAMFCRYVPMVHALGARVILEVPREMRALMTTLAGHDQLIARGDTLPRFDLHCPLMSLPLAFDTDATSIPASVPYLAADPTRIAAWQHRLGPKTRPRIGLAWSGARAFQGDAFRSAPLADLAGLIRPGLDYVCVQRDVRDADADAASRLGLNMAGTQIADFADAAALLATMDLVISVDSAPAHLAGALARPVWVMLPFNAEWRWLRDRADSPWYPTARLIRQATALDWRELAARVGDMLEGEARQGLLF